MEETIRRNVNLSVLHNFLRLGKPWILADLELQ